MIRAILKGSVQFVFGRIPGGTHAYRVLTRSFLGTQSTHIDKLSRAWPGYVQVWGENGIELDGKTLWMHDGGWTPYPFVLMHLLTGCGGIVTMSEGSLEDRYAAKAVEFGLRQEFPGIEVCPERRAVLNKVSSTNSHHLAHQLDGHWLYTDRVKPVLRHDSVDLLITGGTLEHFSPAHLRAFLMHSAKIVKPGGWASHVFDMRDHLYHSDKQYPFLNHLRFSESTYALLFGHRLGYHNRLLPDELKRAIEDAGFEIVLMRRRILPHEMYASSPEDFKAAFVGLDRKLLAPRFEAATDEDLRTVAVHFLCRRR